MNSYRLSQFYTFFKLFLYSIMLLWWVAFDRTFNTLISVIIQIALYRFFEILFFSYFRNRRTRKLKKIAAKMGLDFYKTDKNKIIRPILEGLPFFEEIRPRTKNVLNDLLIILEVMVALLFSIGKRTELENILISKKETQGSFYAIFDFNSHRWSSNKSQDSEFSSSGRSISNQSQTIIIFAFEDLHLQKFSIIAKEKSIWRKIFDKLCQIFGHQRTQGEQISQIFNSQINDFYKAEKNLCTAAKGYRLICYRNNIRIKPRKIQSFLSTGFQALELLKAFNSISDRRDFDYTRLRDLLEAGNWKEADRETTAILLKATGEKVEGTNTNIAITLVDDILLNRVLHSVDALWVEYSKGHFGFSVQKRIWLEVGGKVDYKTECLLADRVGWRVQGKWLYYSDLTFSLNAPQGHLPTTELSELPLGWCYMGKRPLFKIPGTIRLARFIALPGCFIASKL
ncbi:GUN4 domain-containing protein [Iningainema tapete]|uniref:GUN4 domain-containing protein n=1 Tax=Iningainema tapete BLCC-T55 TaxID=2748662 RepID=A0A8J6XND0_9CYAN|nr:GUN4 domain-containing protein [Iningainema tapete]MBD2773572.1 GUN4 domain-containing protein [Iningainema tapete BLCC-T55]